MLWLFILFLTKASFGQLSLGPSIKNVGGSLMMNMPMITSLDVDCDKSGMTVRVEFSQPFNGIIYSKGHYGDPECRYVSPSSGSSSYGFDIPSQGCGSETNSVGNSVELSNIIIVQNDNVVQEIWDVARHLKCNWTENFVKKVQFDPVSVGMLHAEEVVFSGDDSIECWMNIQLGSYPHSSAINSVVRIGDTLSLLIYIRDNNRMFDVSIKDCYAYGGPENDYDTQTIQLTDENGCVLKDKLINQFNTVREDDAEGSVIVAYAYVQAFKFPDVMDVHMSCNTEICKGKCENTCGGIYTTTEPPRRSGSTLFGEPIYTKAPTRPPTQPPTRPPTQPPTHPPTRPPTQPPTRPPTRPPTLPPSPKCFPGSFDPECLDSEESRENDCSAGSFDPKCGPIVIPSKPLCYPGSIDPRCPKPTVPPAPKCYLGSTDPGCRVPENEVFDDPCYPGSTDIRCVPTTKPPRSGSTLYPVTITTTRRGSSLFPDYTVPTTRPPKTNKPTKPSPPSPSLKPVPSNVVVNRAPPQKEPKAKPEPSNGEWVGEPRFHAFHSYHYDKGDGRRTKGLKSKVTFGARLKREAAEPFDSNNIRHVKMTSAIMVAPLDDTTLSNRKRRETLDFPSDSVASIEFIPLGTPGMSAVCMSFNSLTLGLSVLVFLLFVTTSTSILLLLRQRRNK